MGNFICIAANSVAKNEQAKNNINVVKLMFTNKVQQQKIIQI